jgi:hypothetical protein
MEIGYEAKKCDPETTDQMHGNIKPPEMVVEMEIIRHRIRQKNNDNEECKVPSKMTRFHRMG